MNLKSFPHFLLSITQPRLKSNDLYFIFIKNKLANKPNYTTLLKEETEWRLGSAQLILQFLDHIFSILN